jgi:hypothetical protein
MPTRRDFSKRHLYQVLQAFDLSHVVEKPDFGQSHSDHSLTGRVLPEEEAMRIE